MIICVAVIEHAFLTDDFSFSVVASHSSIDTPTFYKVTAMWSSQEGSLLLWAFILSIVSTVSLAATRHKLRDLVPWATAVMMGVAVFFTGLMLLGGDVNPFETLAVVPVDGSGLNPLLQHPSMIIHPPMLYTGYVSLTVPFAFAIGALISRRVDAAWIKSTRGFALIAWTFLSIGIILGSRWSYTELGWGGYWAWDPVENASVMPWLITTAYIHSIMVQEKRGMLKVWNVSLIVASFSLALLGTFLVRSGVLQSIHAFGDSTVGPYFLALIGVVVAGSTWLIISRLDILRSERKIDSLASREAVFLINNLLLIALCAIVFWGTFFPLISELLTGTRSTLAAPWFDRYTTPVAVILVLFTGLGPMLSWRRISREGAKRVFKLPLVAAAIALVVLLVFTDAADSFWALLVFTLAPFTITALIQETWRAARARQKATGKSMPSSIWQIATRNRRRYGGYTAHFGLVVLLVGVAASSSFETKRDIELTPGQSATLDQYEVTYVAPTVSRTDQAIVFGAKLQVDRDGQAFATLNPTRQYHQVTDGRPRGIASYFEGEATSEVGLRAGMFTDFWAAVEPETSDIQRRAEIADDRFAAYMREVVQPQIRKDPSLIGPISDQLAEVQNLATGKIISGYAEPGADSMVTIRVIISPMVTWIWIGAVIAILGALFAAWPSGLLRRRKGSSA
ncbi:MAG: heme lyase CcmF/NrfE family subunit [Solirubrobacterales bacterium]|nr:heme lyase CcmF/NrfE family subunit [Solirubrobacterales bacterium]